MLDMNKEQQFIVGFYVCKLFKFQIGLAYWSKQKTWAIKK